MMIHFAHSLTTRSVDVKHALSELKCDDSLGLVIETLEAREIKVSCESNAEFGRGTMYSKKHKGHIPLRAALSEAHGGPGCRVHKGSSPGWLRFDENRRLKVVAYGHPSGLTTTVIDKVLDLCN